MYLLLYIDIDRRKDIIIIDPHVTELWWILDTGFNISYVNMEMPDGLLLWLGKLGWLERLLSDPDDTKRAILSPLSYALFFKMYNGKKDVYESRVVEIVSKLYTVIGYVDYGEILFDGIVTINSKDCFAVPFVYHKPVFFLIDKQYISYFPPLCGLKEPYLFNVTSGQIVVSRVNLYLLFVIVNYFRNAQLLTADRMIWTTFVNRLLLLMNHQKIGTGVVTTLSVVELLCKQVAMLIKSGICGVFLGDYNEGADDTPKIGQKSFYYYIYGQCWFKEHSKIFYLIKDKSVVNRIVDGKSNVAAIVFRTLLIPLVFHMCVQP
jgi:hypothetical protein